MLDAVDSVRRDTYDASLIVLTGVKDSALVWGYSGQHTDDFREGIPIGDLRWLLHYVGRITDDQIRTGLEASGATAEERQCFATALRGRIDRMKACADGGGNGFERCNAR
jgi:hypothetical protein